MQQDPRVLIVGAGVSGATVARRLAEAGVSVLVAEASSHAGGHCHTYRHGRSGVMVHAHGPHIFHSDDAGVWSFVERFATFEPYRHRVLAVTGGKTYPLPITLQTMSQFFERGFTAEEARLHIGELARAKVHDPETFEGKARSTLGDALYEAFFDGYTRKQWGQDPALLPASIFARLPIRFDRNQSYYHHDRVGLPVGGYTAMVERMLKHPEIELRLDCPLQRSDSVGYRHAVYTGAVDRWFDYRFGRLTYRTLDFETIEQAGTYQSVAQVNYCDLSVPWTRIVEHKHFEPWEQFDETLCLVETSRACGPNDTPYYPVRLAAEEQLFGQYRALAQREHGVSFVGRLATYRYIDMDVAIGEAIAAADRLLECFRDGRQPAAFFI